MSYLFPKSVFLAVVALFIFGGCVFYLIVIPRSDLTQLEDKSYPRFQKREGIKKELYIQKTGEKMTLEAKRADLILEGGVVERLEDVAIATSEYQVNTPELHVNYHTKSATTKSVECQKDNDHCTAESVIWDMSAETAVAKQGKGIFQTSMGEIYFSADEIFFDHTLDSVLLSKQVLITSSSFGSLTTDQSAQIFFKEGQMSRFIVLGDSQIIQDDKYTIECDGVITGDIATEKIELNKGNMQVLYRDQHGIAMGDTVQILFIKNQEQSAFREIKMTGEVLIENRFGIQMPLAQYILSDEVTYYPDKSQVVVTAYSGRRALFYDKLNNMTMSAPAFNIDFVHDQPKVAGVGDVRLELAEKEWEVIKKRFIF